MIAIDQPLLLELDAHPRATAEELQHALRDEAPLAAIARWLRAHEGWLVVQEAGPLAALASGRGLPRGTGLSFPAAARIRSRGSAPREDP